jgi:hypothetical protein
MGLAAGVLVDGLLEHKKRPQHVDTISSISSHKIIGGEVQHLGQGTAGSSIIASAQPVRSNLALLSVVSWGTSRLDVFGVGTDNAMYHRAGDGNAWYPSSWEYLGGSCSSPPVMITPSPNSLGIYVIGTDNALYHKWWENSWGPSKADWQCLGGFFHSPPTVVA